MDYFPHDTKAMSDDKLLALRIDRGLEAVACYWAVLEKIYAEEQPFDISETNVEARSVLLRLGIGFGEFREHVFHMVKIGLFVSDDSDPNVIMSERAAEQIAALERKRETARQNGKKNKPRTKPKAKPNQRKANVGSDVATDAKPTSAEYKPIGLHKVNQIGIAPDGAAVAKATPPVATCPMCGTEVRKTGMGGPDFWWCDNCQESLAEGKAVFKEAVA